MLTTIDRYVLWKLLRVFLPTLLCLSFLFFLGASFRLLKDADVSLGQVLITLPWVVPILLPFLVPFAWLVTVTLVLGRMVAEQEVLAFTSLGIPQRSLAWPAVLVAVPLSALSVWLTASVAPYCYQRSREAGQAVFLQFFELGQGEHLSRTFDSEGFDIYVRRYAPGGRLEGVVLHYDMGGPGARRAAQVVAARGQLAPGSRTDRIVLALEDVTVTLQSGGDGATARPVRAHLERLVQAIGLSTRRRLKSADYPTADLRGLARRDDARQALALAMGGLVAARQGQGQGGVVSGLDARMEVGTRAMISAAPLLLTLLAAALTLLLRSTSALVPFAASIAAACGLYYAPLLLGTSLGTSLGTPWVLALPCVTSLGGAGLAAWRAGR
jgi:lipopolysaccharide export LptBFGC system permease protein LptF